MDKLIIKTLRFNLDGPWTAEEMGELLLFTAELYNYKWAVEELDKRNIIIDVKSMRLGIFNRNRHIPIFNPEDISNIIPQTEQLQIVRIRFSSPGLIDVAGIGQIMGHLKDFFIRLIELQQARRQRELENREKELKNLQLEMENAKIQLQSTLEIKEKELKNRQLELDNEEKELRNRELLLNIVKEYLMIPVSSDSNLALLEQALDRSSAFIQRRDLERIKTVILLEEQSSSQGEKPKS